MEFGSLLGEISASQTIATGTLLRDRLMSARKSILGGGQLHPFACVRCGIVKL